MTEQRKPFVPLLFGADINVYSMARAFHEAYGIQKTYAVGKFPSGPAYNSRLIHYTAEPRADVQEVFLPLVNRFAEEHKDETVLILGCGDNYLQLISGNKANYRENVVAPYIDLEQMNSCIKKEVFYGMCEKAGLDYPATFIYQREMGHDFELPFGPPYIIKPSNNVDYWQHPFPTQKKVDMAHSREEMLEILDNIYNAGYSDTIILQDFIPGDDSYMRVLTSYSGKDGKVKLMCLGHVLLEEHTPHGIGNHAVIITESEPELEEKVKNMLEAMHYVGFSNCDIKYDRRDGKFKLFEINVRQGRSNYYVTGSGHNITKWLVEDWLYDNPVEEIHVSNPSLWTVVPKGVAFKYIVKKYHPRMRQLIREGKWSNPLLYKPDRGFLRMLRTWKNLLGHYVKFKKYYGVPVEEEAER
ncbi:MAG: ATP-grasp domain-containing protein [Bacillota bacterium]|nr:ATP-grasp domain-containing protein [Bacillota bacterium]